MVGWASRRGGMALGRVGLTRSAHPMSSAIWWVPCAPGHQATPEADRQHGHDSLPDGHPTVPDEPRKARRVAGQKSQIKPSIGWKRGKYP